MSIRPQGRRHLESAVEPDNTGERLPEKDDPVKDEQKTKAQLIAELNELRSRLTRYEESSDENGVPPGESNGPVALLQTLIDTIPTPLFYKNKPCRYLGCNRAFEFFSGLSKDKIIGSSVWDVFPEETASLYHTMDRKLLRNPGVQIYEAPTLFPNGESRIIEYHKATFTDSKGDVAGIVGIMVDTTRRKAAEEALKESEREFRTLAEQTPFGISIMDRNRRFAYFNPKFTQLFGYTLEDLPNKDAWFHNFYPDDGVRRELRSRWEESFARESGRSGFREMIHPLRCRNGRDRVVRMRAVILEDDKHFMFYDDITSRINDIEELSRSREELKRLYEEASRAQDVYASLLRSSPDSIVIYDSEGRAVFVNSAFTQVFGWTLEEVQGKRIDFVPESEKNATSEVIRRIFQEDQICRGFETRRLTKDGRILDVNISASGYHDHEGKLEGSLVILRDISDQKVLEAQLLQAHKMEALGTLAGGVAHDFNNIMQAITGYVQVLLMENSPESPDYPKLQGIEKSAHRAGTLTRRLLMFSRKVDAELRAVDLNTEVNQVSKLLTQIFPKMIDIQLQLDENVEAVNADPVQLEQIMMNLGVNARDAMVDGGKLIFRTENVVLDKDFCARHMGAKEGRFVMLSVSDTGHGIDPSILDRVFDPFFTTKPVGQGTGLGLAMVYGIVKAHGGYITCSSQPEVGTTFRIYFPAVARRPEARRSPDWEEKNPKGKGELLLLVDDEEGIREVGKDLLTRFGYQVLTAESGERAVDVYKTLSSRPDLVILDLSMPGMGGMKCLKILRELNPAVRVIISTGYLDQSRLKDLPEAQDAAFVGKPYKINELLKTLRRVLDGKPTG